MRQTTTADRVLQALEPYELQQEKGGRWRCNSPLRPNSNSHAFSLLIEDGEHGTWKDHVTDESGSLYDLAARLGLEPARREVQTTKRQYNGLEDYAAAHGITADTLRAAGWAFVFHQSRPALEFRTKGGKRWRFLDGNKPAYISESGYNRCWYGLNATTLKRLSEGHNLVLCNGEISTIAAHHHGLAAACVTSGEKGSIPPDLIAELREFMGAEPAPVIVAMDCDKAGRRAGRQLVEQLRAEGFTAWAVDLGLGDGGDLADFCMIHTGDSALALNTLPSLAEPEHEAETPSPWGWFFIPEKDLGKLPGIEWIIPGQIPERGMSVIVGASGAGKSFVSVDLALQIAQTRPVVYMACEGEYGFHQRTAAWKHHHKKADNLLTFCMGAVEILESEQKDAFIQGCQQYRPDVVFIDTLARSMVGADENSARDMGLFVRACQQIQRVLDCAVVIIHHTGKDGRSERGSSALRGAADVMMMVSAEDERIRLECVKTKDAEPFDPKYLALLPVTVALEAGEAESAVIVPADQIEQTEHDKLYPNQRRILELLANDVYISGASFSDIVESGLVPRGSIPRTLSRLLKLKFLEQGGEKSAYIITEAGKMALNRSSRYHKNHLVSQESPGITQESPPAEVIPQKRGDSCDTSDTKPLLDLAEIPTKEAGISENYYSKGG